MCGENVRLSDTRSRRRGSSPRVRGKPGDRSIACRLIGLIPACAGKTLSFVDDGGNGRAHPRVCGENFNAAFAFCCMAGSSPRVRGKPIPRPTSRAGRRLIPACAGKTTHCALTEVEAGAHPRVCGENGTPQTGQRVPVGSSPRVRGKQEVLGTTVDGVGLIPACAGKTKKLKIRLKSQKAHPRVCGENVLVG